MSTFRFARKVFGSHDAYVASDAPLAQPEGSLTAWNEHLLRDMLAAGTLVLRDGVVHEH